MNASESIRHTLFISDLHLNPTSHHLNALFDQFIRETLAAGNVDAVYILGDFFDVWLGDDLMEEWERKIAHQLAQLAQKKIPVYLMVGNRDFLLGERFIKTAQCVFLSDPAIIMLYGKRFVLKHGDDLCQEDKRYQIFRAFVRLSWVKRWYLSLPQSWRKSIAHRIRRASQQRGMRDIYAKVSSRLVEDLLEKNQAATLIHGHTHCPQLTEKHIVLSDWNTRGNRLLVGSDGQLAFDYFD